MVEDINKVSVALCTYNGGRYLEKQLNSILEQTYPIDEIIIVDDCSTDETISIVKEYQLKNPVIKLFLNDKNLGSNKSFKHAISLATNDLIALCDQDDIWYPNKIETQIEAIANSGYNTVDKPLVAFHDLCLMDDNEVVTNESFWELHQFNAATFNFRKLLLYNIITGCTCILNKRMKEELIKSDMKDIIMHDYLIALIGYGFGNVVHTDEPLMYYRSHSTSVTEKEKVTLNSRIKSLVKRVKNKSYLKPNILQIEQFNFLYGDNIAGDKKVLMNKIIELKDRSVLSKMVYRWFLN
jgi:glycosyltransferase involved in cell wall biosynthesis